jgi:hypothetical protein
MKSFPTEIIHIGVNRWDGLVQREQHLMIGLSRFYRILFIDPPLSILTVSMGKIKGEKWTFRGRLRRINERLTVYTPYAFPPFSQQRAWIHRRNTHLLVSQIKKLIRRFSYREYLFGLSWPLWGSALKELRPRWSYYDCSDDFLKFPGLKTNKEMLKKFEEELLQSVNLVFCSSQKIKEDKSILHPHCFLIPNGIDSSFLQAMRAKGEVPYEMQDMRRPILGYVGTIGEWVDLDALTHLARSRTDWSLVMIGPSASRQVSSMLKGIPNLRTLGERRYEVLPNYIRNFDICLIPFKVNEFTRSIYPTKFHQYLGAGKPVISSHLPDLEIFTPWVEFYSDAKEMEIKVERSLREDSEEKVLDRMRIASENTWDRRVESMIQVFNEFFKE